MNLATGVLLKPLVFGLAAAALARAWKAGASSAGARTWGMAFAAFLAGEAACGIDVYVRHSLGLWNEAFHDLLMAAAYGFFIAGSALYARDRGICWHTGCRGHGTCGLRPGDCGKSTRCGTFPSVLTGAIAIMAFLPLAAPMDVFRVSLASGLRGRAFGTFVYRRSFELAVFQQRLLPLLAIAGLAIATFEVARTKKIGPLALWAGSLGAGCLAFAIFRFGLLRVFLPDIGLAVFSEEALELLFVAVFLLGFHRRVQSPRSVRVEP